MSTQSSQPTLTTPRLVLRPFRPEDADRVQEIVSEREIAANTLHIPHPYPDGMAAEWIATHPAKWERGEGAIFAAARREDGRVVGAMGLDVEPPHRRAELGYWVAKPFWNLGYATEGARGVMAFGFHALGLHRIQATHYARNPQSGAVMRKLGMRHEGSLREHIFKWGVFEDIEVYGILRDEFEG
ncbi:MAG TPA: GNAT family N-acetyltransferase [Longimicrobium sp.]|jgi:RimJ/RimL family protein N-acetyltransferase